ncbi:MAG: efflux RND transporter permease subunit [Chitinophagaceae bacterium]
MTTVRQSQLSAFRVVLFFCLAGLLVSFCIPRLSVQFSPSPRTEQLIIQFNIPDYGPELIEHAGTTILENAFSQLRELEKIRSSSWANSGFVELHFRKGTDMDLKRLEIATLIRHALTSFPAGASYPIIMQSASTEKNETARPLLTYIIKSKASPYQTQQIAESIFRPMLIKQAGIGKIEINTPEVPQWVIRFDKEKCLVWGIKPQDIQQTIAEHAQAYYPGNWRSETGYSYFIMRQPMTVDVAEQLELISLTGKNKQMVRLRDIASVSLEMSKPATYYGINGEQTITLAVFGSPGTNSIHVANSLKKLMEQTEKKLPGGYSLSLAGDETKFIKQEIDKNTRRILLSVLVLVLFITLVTRNKAYLLTVLSGLAITCCLTVLSTYLLNITLHLYTIAALSLSFGLIADNMIVMTDYTRRGLPRQVFPAMIAATAITSLAMFLTYLLPENEKLSLTDFAGTIVLALALSLIVAKWYIPSCYRLLSSKMPLPQGRLHSPYQKSMLLLKMRIYRSYMHLLKWLGGKKILFSLILLLLLGVPLFMLPEKLGDVRVYNESIGSPFYQNKVRPYTDKWLGGALRLFMENNYQRSGYRDPEETQLRITARLPYGNSPAQMNDLLAYMSRSIQGITGVSRYSVQVHSGQRGGIEIFFTEEGEQTGVPAELKTKLVNVSLQLGGVEWTISGVGRGFNSAGGAEAPSYRVTLKGYNYETLEQLAAELKSHLLSSHRVHRVNINEAVLYTDQRAKQFELEIDAKAASYVNAGNTAILKGLHLYASTSMIGQMADSSGEFRQVRFQEKQAEDFSVNWLTDKTFYLSEGSRAVRIGQFTKLRSEYVTEAIHKDDRQYLRAISFEYAGSKHAGDVFTKQLLSNWEKTLPAGYVITSPEFSETHQSNFKKYGLLITLLLAGCYVATALLFENLRQPFIIMMIMPVSFLGIFLTFGLGHFYFDQGGYAAFLLSGALVVNAAIFIINDYNYLKRTEGGTSNNLLLKAITRRARTVAITTMSTCCSLVPFLTDGEDEVFWFSLAVGTIGGLLTSLLAVWLVLPVWLYKRRS